MAKKHLKQWKNTLFVVVPPYVEIVTPEDWLNYECDYAYLERFGAPLKTGKLPLRELVSSSKVPKRVILILASTDVNIFELEAFRLSDSQLKLALPNLLEDQLLSETAETFLIPTSERAEKNEKRVVFAIAKKHLLQITQVFLDKGFKEIYLLPTQLTIPEATPQINFAEIASFVNIETITLRLNKYSSVALNLKRIPDIDISQSLSSLVQLSTDKDLVIRVPEENISSYQSALANGMYPKLAVTSNNGKWHSNIDAAQNHAVSFDNFSHNSKKTRSRFQIWKHPILLLLLLAVVNTIALSFTNWQVRHQNIKLQESILTVFNSHFPKDMVILDPVAQMQQKLPQHNLSIVNEKSFFSLLIAYGEFNENVQTQTNLPSAPIDSLEYRNGSLYIHFSPNTDPLFDEKLPLLTSQGLKAEESSTITNGMIWRVSLNQ